MVELEQTASRPVDGERSPVRAARAASVMTNWCCFALAVVVGVGLFTGSAAAQMRDARGAPGTGLGDDPLSSSAAAMTSFEVEDQLMRARTFAEQGRPDVSVQLLRRVLEEHRDSMVEVEAGWYLPAWYAVERAIVDGGPELMEQHLRMAEPAASAIMPEATDTSPEAMESLRRIAREFFLTSHGDDAAFRLAQRHLDEQSWLAAAQLLRRVLEHPDPSLELADVRARLALAWSRMAQSERAKALGEELGASAEARSPVLRALSEELSRKWRGLFGDGAEVYAHTLADPMRRGRLAGDALDGLSIEDELWSAEYGLEPLEVRVSGRMRTPWSRGNVSGPKSTAQSLGSHWASTRQLPAGTVVFSEAGEAFFRSLDGVVCAELSTGEVRWKTREWLPVLGGGNTNVYSRHTPQFFVDGEFQTQPSPGAAQVFGDRASRRLAYIDGAVYQLEGGAPFGVSSLPMQIYSNGRNEVISVGGVLASYDAITGELRWRRTLVERQPDAMERGGFASLPVAYGGMLLVATESEGEIGLAALDPATGTMIWRKAVGAARSSPAIGDLMMIALDGDKGYLATGHGLVVAFDALSGDVQWASSYSRGGKEARSNWRFRVSSFTGWEENAVLLDGAVLYVTPSDAQKLLVFDAMNGELLAQRDAQRWRYPLGVVDGDMVLASTDRVDRYDPMQDEFTWRSRFREPISGRGVLVGDSVYIPATSRITRLDLGSGTRLNDFSPPKYEHQPMGNLYASRGQLVMLGAGVVRSFGDLEVWADQLEVLAQMGDVSALLQRARIKLRTGEMKEGLDSLRLALRNARGTGRVNSVRGLLLRELTTRSVSLPWAQASLLLDEAADVARGRGELQRVLMARADALIHNRRLVEAADTLAPLLTAESGVMMHYADGRKLRLDLAARERMSATVKLSRSWLEGSGSAPWASDLSGSAGDGAEDASGSTAVAVAVVPSSGGSLPGWESVEAVEPWWVETSRTALETARSTGSVTALWAVHETFGPTPAGKAAAMAAIDRAMADGQFAVAELLAGRLTDTALQADAYQRVAQAMSRQERLSGASLSAWRRVAELTPERVIEGRTVSEIIADRAVEPLAPLAMTRKPAVDRIHWEQAWTKKEMVNAYFVELAARPEGPSAWMRDKQLIVGGKEGELQLLSLDDGETLWKWDLPGGRLNVSVNNWSLVAMNGISLSSGGLANEGGVLVIPTGSKLTAIDLYTGMTLWEATENIPVQQTAAAMRSYGLAPVHVDQGYVAVVSESPSELLLFDLATGACLWRTPIDDAEGAGARMGGVRIVGDRVHTLNVTTDNWIAYDLFSGRELMRKVVESGYAAFGRNTVAIMAKNNRGVVGYSLEDGQKLYTKRLPRNGFHRPNGLTADASAFGGWLMSVRTRRGRESHSAALWIDIDTGKMAEELQVKGRSTNILSMAISRDGSRVAAVGYARDGRLSKMQCAVGPINGRAEPSVRFDVPQETGSQLNARMLVGEGDFFTALIRDAPNVSRGGTRRASSDGTAYIFSHSKGGLVPGMALPSPHKRASFFANAMRSATRGGMLLVAHGGDQLTAYRPVRGEREKPVDLSKTYEQLVSDAKEARKKQLLAQVRNMLTRRNDTRIEIVKAKRSSDVLSKLNELEARRKKLLSQAEGGVVTPELQEKLKALEEERAPLEGKAAAAKKKIKTLQSRLNSYNNVIRNYRERGFKDDVDQLVKQFNRSLNKQLEKLEAQKKSD